MSDAASSTPGTFIFVAQTSVAWPQQEQFLRFSGDRNPMHTDPVAARRTPPGAVVVYGMHMVLWALDRLAAETRIDASLLKVSVRFLKWIYLENMVSLWFRAGTKMQFELRVGSMVALSGSLQNGPIAPSPERPFLPVALKAGRDVPAMLLLHEVEGCHGEAPVADLAMAEALFPALAAVFGPQLAAEIATCSYVVGMEVPGLHSIDSVADWELSPCRGEGLDALRYEVTAVDHRFRRARLLVAGSAISGTMEAFVRHPPVRQATMDEVKRQVIADEFAGMRALVVGGSRGLGEVAAKCIAAGGGHCVLTYSVGRQDAERVAAEIREGGGAVAVIRYDAREAAAPQFAALEGSVTHLLYFATGPMFRQKSCLAAHNALFVQGFEEVCVELLRPESERVGVNSTLRAFYPSTTLLDGPCAGGTEFAASKAAGEQRCREMEPLLPRLRVLVTRLPRLLTDQTAPMVPERFPDTVAVLLPILRRFRS